MGFFNYLFGSSSTKHRLSRESHALFTQDIEYLVSRIKIKTLDATEEKIVEQAIINRRHSNKISLWQIDEVLRTLEHKSKISQYDRKALINVFEAWFKKKYT